MKIVELGDVLKYEQPTRYIVRSEDYDDSYEIPVLTAGKSFLLGKTNEKDNVYDNHPVIIFDDFTTAFHYVDFPFKVKSSAMKLLKEDSDRADLKYLYHKMKTISFDAKQHKRYWISKYSKIKIPLPDLATQQAIVRKLDAAQKLCDLSQTLIEKYEKLSQSLFLEMFGDPVTNPKGWEIKKLGEITSKITDGKHGNCDDEINSGYYFVSAKDIFNDRINYEEARQIKMKDFEEVHRRTNLESGDLVMVNTGSIGKMAIVRDNPRTSKTTFQKSVAIIKPDNNYLNVFYLKDFFSSFLNFIVNKGSGSVIKNLLLSEMRKFEILLPPIELQNQFAENIAEIEKQKALAEQELAKSERLFAALLQESFS